MKRTEYKTWLIEFVENNKYSYVKKLRAKANKHILEWIDAQVPLLAKNKFYSLQTKLYWIFNGIKDFPLCPNCNKVKLTMHNVKSLYVGYGTLTCNKKCRYELAQKHNKETCIKRYGVEFTFQTEQLKKKSQETCIAKYGKLYASGSPEVVAKSKATCKARYGVESYTQTDEYVAKTKATNIRKYGVDSYAKTDEFIEKTKATCNERYGVDFPSQSEQAKETSKQTCIDKYGVSSFSKTQEFKDKVEKTNIERYGDKNPWSKNSSVRHKTEDTKLVKYGSKTYNNREKAKKTTLERYGFANVAQIPESILKRSIARMTNSYKQLMKNEYAVPLFSVEDYICKTPDTIFKWHCNKCNTDFEAKINWNFYNQVIKTVARCPKCYPDLKFGSSAEERSFVSAIRKLYDGKVIERYKVLKNVDNEYPKEIDCYLPELKIGFEYNGLYYHSSCNKSDDSKNSHMLKTLAAEKVGIMLMHIRSDIWYDKNEELLQFISMLIKNKQEAFKLAYDTNENTIIVDRSIFNKSFMPTGFVLMQEIPATVDKIVVSSRTYYYKNCGQLVYKRV